MQIQQIFHFNNATKIERSSPYYINVNMIWLVLSTLPHYLAAIPVYEHADYATLIILSSTFSLCYNVFLEHALLLTALNYSATLLWFWYDFCFALKYEKIMKPMLVGNLIVLLTYISIGTDDERVVWHLISGAKCFYVAALIRRYSRREKLRRRPYLYE